MKVLLVGSGDIGTRHLQAIAMLPVVSVIEVVDPRPEALALGQARLREIADRQPTMTYRWLPSLDAASRDAALCVIATQAKGRCQLVEAVVRQTSCRAFLLEKTVAQSITEYERLLQFAEREGLSIWVNCKTRVYSFHQRTKAQFRKGDPIQFHVSAGNHGLVVNGIHSVDLFVYYDESHRLTPVGMHIDPVLHPSKRGPEVFDLSGMMQAVSDTGSQLTLSFARDHLAPPVYTVASATYRFMVDQWARWAYESRVETNWMWQPVPFVVEMDISTMSKAFVADILHHGRCQLPTLQECYPAHAYLLKELLPVFATLQKRDLTTCPIV